METALHNPRACGLETRSAVDVWNRQVHSPHLPGSSRAAGGGLAPPPVSSASLERSVSLLRTSASSLRLWPLPPGPHPGPSSSQDLASSPFQEALPEDPPTPRCPHSPFSLTPWGSHLTRSLGRSLCEVGSAGAGARAGLASTLSVALLPNTDLRALCDCSQWPPGGLSPHVCHGEGGSPPLSPRTSLCPLQGEPLSPHFPNTQR